MIEQLRAALEAAQRELHARKETLDAAHKRVMEIADDAAEGEGEAAQGDFDDAASAFDEAAAEVERTKRNLDDAERREKIVADNAVVAAAARSATPRGAKAELTYRPDSAERSFFADAYAAEKMGDPSARERIHRHAEEMRDLGDVHKRDVGTTAFAGLTVPQYLIDLFAPLARAGAPLLSTVRKAPLPPSGMTLNISRITTGTGVAAQASENAAVQETNIDDTLLTINVRQYAGQQDVTRQALERSERVDAVVFQDLIADYFTVQDSALINADGTSGTHLGIRSTGSIISVSYTDASPTVAELYPKLADAIQQMASQRFAPATTIFMHPRRWGWITAALDTTNRPFAVPNPNGPFNALAVGDAPEYGAVVGSMHGLPVVTDANIPTNLGAGTNEDVILVERVPDLLYWQDGDGSPRRFTFEQSNAPQSIRLAVWGDSAFSAGRYPAASAVISGTGLVTPTF